VRKLVVVVVVLVVVVVVGVGGVGGGGGGGTPQRAWAYSTVHHCRKPERILCCIISITAGSWGLWVVMM
jgi:hypothetical protein